MASTSVFISYARQTNLENAQALHAALGKVDEGLAFLDSRDIEQREHIPGALAGALFGSRVVVIFLDEHYFERAYCLREFHAAAAAPALFPPRSGMARTDDASIVLALPLGPTTAALIERLPPHLRHGNWPRADETGKIVELVLAGLKAVDRTLGERLSDAGGLEPTKAILFQQPAPERPSGVPVYPLARRPSLGAAFVGRGDELWRIHHALVTLRRDPSLAAAGTVVLEGGGGFGKTRLATEYFHRFGLSHFTGGCFWLEADTSEHLLEVQFHGILKALKPETPELAEFQKKHLPVAEELARAIDALPTTQPVLFVANNVPEPAPSETPKPLSTWCPAFGRVALLVTSRVRYSLFEAGVEEIHVPPLPSDPAVSLLADKVRNQLPSQEHWARIAAWVGGLPLALELLNRLFRAHALSPTKLLARLENESPVRELEPYLQALRGRFPQDALRGITETLLLSYEKLPEDAKEAARLIAQLASEPIPEDVVDAFGPEVMKPETKSTLIMRSWVSEVVGGDVAFLGTMHSVLAEFLRLQSTIPEEEAIRACNTLADVMEPERCRAPEDRHLMRACLPHAEVLFRRLLRGSPQEQLVALELGFSISIFLLVQGMERRARETGEQLLKESVALLGPGNPTSLDAKNSLATILYELGELEEAQRLHEEALEAKRRIMDEHDPRVLLTLHNLAATVKRRGQLQRALELEKHVLEVEMWVLGSEHPSTLMTMSNLASTLMHLGEYATALEVETEALDVRRRVLGEAHPETLLSLNNLAVAHSKLGDLERGLELSLEGLDICLRIFGRKHRQTIMFMHNVATDLKEMGDLPAARRHFEEAVSLAEEVLGSEHPDTLTYKGHLALTLRSQGHFALAERLGREVMETSGQVLGEDHPEFIERMINLAESRRALGDLLGTRQLTEKAVALAQRILGDDHPTTLLAMHNHAGVLAQMRELQQARRIFEQLVDIKRQKLGEHHPDFFMTLAGLALVLMELGQWQTALELQRRVLQASDDALGRRNPFTTISAGNFFSALHRHEQNREAVSVFMEYLQWLATADVDSLSVEQKAAREMVIAFMHGLS